MGKCLIGPNQKDADLWEKLANRVARLGPQLQHVGKVVSHQDASGLTDEADAWIVRGNNAADALANNAFLRFPEVMQLWKKLRHCWLMHRLHCFLLLSTHLLRPSSHSHLDG